MYVYDLYEIKYTILTQLWTNYVHNLYILCNTDETKKFETRLQLKSNFENYDIEFKKIFQK